MLSYPFQLLSKSESGSFCAVVAIIIWIVMVVGKNLGKTAPKVPKPWESR